MERTLVVSPRSERLGIATPKFPCGAGFDDPQRFAALDLEYQGYVIPQGDVTMQTPVGQTFVGSSQATQPGGASMTQPGSGGLGQSRAETRPPGDPLRPEPPVTANEF